MNIIKILLITLLLITPYVVKSTEQIVFQRFNDIYEASGVVQLPDGRILIIEDEKEHPFSLLRLNNQNYFQRLPLSKFVKIGEKQKIIKLNDLEGISLGKNNWVYAITSHSRNSLGQRKKSREQLVRFHVGKKQLIHFQSLSSLTKQIAKLLPNKSIKNLNIEGLAYDLQSDSLLIGLRRPRLNNKAIIIKVSNIEQLFEQKRITQLIADIITLDLQGKTIRSINYNPTIKGFIIVAGSKKGRNTPFQLWLWKNNKLFPLQIKDINNIGYTEGTSTIKTAQGETLLLVMDDGERGKATGHYMMIPYNKIRMKHQTK